MTDADWSLFFTRPVSLIFLVLAVLSVAWSVRAHILARRKADDRKEPA
jgi:putative tricarboxylic transport membrane protein